MRVLHADTGTSMRGGQWQALYLVQGLQREGVGGVLLARRDTPLWREARARGIDTRPYSGPALWRLSKQVDLVHAHSAGAHTAAAVFSRVPVIVSRRVAFPLATGALSCWKYRRGAHYIAVSEHVRKVMIEAGIPPGKVSVVYDGVPAGPRTSDQGGIVALRSEDPGKGSDLVRQAAALARVEVRFSEDLAKDLNDASIFLYLSRSEGLGSAALAAMAAGVPVIASRTGGLPEIVQDGVTGLLVENDPEQIAQALLKLKEDAALRRALGEQGRKLATESFSVAEMVRGTLDVYRRVRPW